jgi:hypothetical protein
MPNYYKKYLKYKQKYLQLKGGATQEEFDTRFRNSTGESISTRCPDSYYNFSFIEQYIINYCKLVYPESDYNTVCMPDILNDLNNFKTNKISKFAKYLNNSLNDHLVDNNIITRTFADELPIPNTKVELQNNLDRIKSKIGTENKLNLRQQLQKTKTELIPVTQLIEEGGEFFINKLCQKIDSAFNIYFVNDKLSEVKSIFGGLTINCSDSPVNSCNNILLRPQNYLNIAHNTEILSNKDCICLEGNRIYADPTCRIASGSITSCCFMVLFFEGGNMIVSHLGGVISNIPLFEPEINVKRKIANETCLQRIRESFRSEIPKLKKVFFGGFINDYHLVINNDTIDFVYVSDEIKEMADEGIFYAGMTRIIPDDSDEFKTHFLTKLGYIGPKPVFRFDSDRRQLYQYIATNNDVHYIKV